ncbi:MAG: hypothetical protein J7M26_01185, partial [Armatimonadetes bacterium]|nr:hypothetical protein [Armatimonadota bacterium]
LTSQDSTDTLGPGAAEALRLLGRQVTWIDEKGLVHRGKVSQVQRSDSSWVLEVGDKRLSFGQVLAVKD